MKTKHREEKVGGGREGEHHKNLIIEDREREIQAESCHVISRMRRKDIEGVLDLRGNLNF